MGPKYKDASLPVDARVADLLALMSTEEKVAQLNQELAWKACTKRGDRVEVAEEFKKLLSGHGIGSLYGVLRADPWTAVTLETGLSPRQGAEAVNAIQRYALENTRLGIPILFGEECSHGHQAIGATVFPAPITVASTWNPDLYERMAAAIAAETRAQGGAATYSPVLDVVRDPRWGRTEETFGEDPFLCSRFAEAAVRGLQGRCLDGSGSIVATIKHFAAYGCSEGGHNGATAHVGPRELRETCLPPFRAAVQAGAESVMCSYNDIDGMPAACNRELLTGILRSEWGFRGFVVSDMGCIALLHRSHRVTRDARESAVKALEAGVDMEMSGGCYTEPLLQAIREGKIAVEKLDAAAGRILRVKFLLGLFEKPFADPDRAENVIGCAAHRQLARDVARQGIILLKNDNGILPLRKNIGSVAVIGPNADAIYNQLGDYTAPQRRREVVSVLDGIRMAVSPATRIRYARGCGIKDASRAGFTEAVAAARESEVAVVVVGGSSARDFGPEGGNPETGAAVVSGASAISDMDCGEGFDLASLELQGVQRELLESIHATGVPMVVILIKGRPMAINWIADHAAAILDSWYPGQEGGHAIADVLFGDCCPGGRLTVTVPKSAAQLPVFYNAKSAERGRYVDMDSLPLYPFGYGLSYTAFSYSNLLVTPDRIDSTQQATVSVDVTNTGKREGDEVVQLYLRDDVASVTRPVRELKGFRRIHLAPGQTKTVSFTLTQEELQCLGADMCWKVEPGTFTIMVGGNQHDVLTTHLEVIE